VEDDKKPTLLMTRNMKDYRSTGALKIDETIEFDVHNIQISEKEEKELKHFISKGEYLTKYAAGGLGGSLKKRYVYVDVKNGILYYTKKKGDAATEKQTVPLHSIEKVIAGKGTKVMDRSRNKLARSDKVFSVETSKRSYDFGASSKEMMEKWVKALTVVMEEHMDKRP